MLSQARNASEGSPPTSTNHQLATNPYKSKYGEKWEEEIKQSAQMRKFVSICSLVWHIYAETKSAFLGTEHNFFYHDALSLMTANEKF